MRFSLALITLFLVMDPSSLAQELSPDHCAQNESSTRVEIPAGDRTIPATACKYGDELTLIADEPISRQHLIYFGINFGLPFLGYEATYVQKRKQAQLFHASIGTEGSLGASALTVRGGYHPWGNSVYVGGTSRALWITSYRKGFSVGPEIGLSGGSRFITGRIAMGLFGSYEGMGSVHLSPEISFGLRMRIVKFKTRPSRQ